MSINNHNAGTELNDVNVGALAISDDNDKNNNDKNNRGGHSINVAEYLGLSDDHPIARFFNDEETVLARKTVEFGGVQVAGKIRCTSKKSWSIFGGNDNWNKLLAVHTHPLTHRGLGLGKLEAGPSMSYLKRLLTDSPVAPRPPPKPFSEYSFELKANILGKKLQTFVPLGVCKNGILFPFGPRSYGDDLVDTFKAAGGAPGDHWTIDGSLDVRVFDRTTGKFATLMRTETIMLLAQPTGPFFHSMTEYALIHNHLDVIDDPGASPRSPIFLTRAEILCNEKEWAVLVIPFIDGHQEHVENKDQILRLMERLEWK